MNVLLMRALRNKGATLLLLVLAVVAIAWPIDRARRYRAGVTDGKAAVYAQVSQAHAEALQRTLNTERQAAATLAAKQAEIEKEREHAENIITNLRIELGRVQHYAARQGSRRDLPATANAASAPDETTARGWQLFGHCAAEYAGVAEIADRQRNDLAEWQAYGRVVQGMH